jgi:hypothetical protein
MIDAFRETEIAADRRRWLAAFSLAIVSGYVLPWLALLGRVGPRDYDQFLVFHELQYWNASLFGLAKQWSPLMCGGLSLAGEPQVPFMSLSMLLSYAIGPLAGLEIAIALYFIVGWAGAYLYAGLWLRGSSRRALAASLFIGNGFFICRYGYGHVDFIPFLTLPMMLWTLHRSVAWMNQGRGIGRVLQLLFASLLLGAGISVAIDGSPVAIIHLMLWVALYGLVLAAVARSAAPLLLLGAALLFTLMLDAGYLWPMVAAQADFPRLTADSFTNPLALPWFLLLPLHGKLIVPATGNGHELSVFIGPLLAYLIWRYRHRLLASVPPQLKWPLLIVSAVSIWFGMGSLRPLHVPIWLSPFDVLRPLPGFRSLLVTGRFWGFLALPLSLLGAAALWRFAALHPRPKGLRVWMLALLSLQLGFQLTTILSHWLPAHRYPPVDFHRAFVDGAEEITYVVSHNTPQGSLITPTRAVQNCYNGDDFIHADVTPGSMLLKSVVGGGAADIDSGRISATFMSWNQIRVALHSPVTAPSVAADERSIQLILNQAYHPYWHSSACQVAQTDRGNLALNCGLSSLARGVIDLDFHDPISARGAQISRISWTYWLLAIGIALPAALWWKLSAGKRL